MSVPRRLRMSALVAAAAVIAGALLPSVPAAADEPPTPAPTATSTPDPSATSTPDPAPASDASQTLAPATYPSSGPGSVVIDNSTGTVTAVDADFPAAHTAFHYQWYRGSTAITGATKATYALVSADRNQLIKVRISTTVPGYSNTIVRYSPARNLTITNPGGAWTLSGTPRPGLFLSSNHTGSYLAEGTPISVAITWTWLRNGVDAHYGINDFGFLLTGADTGKTITVKVTASKPGWISNVTTSNGLKVLPGQLVSAHQPDITSSGLVLTVGAALSDVVDANQSGWTADKITYQWYRADTAVPGKTGPTYTLTQSDWGKRVSVRLIYSKPGWSSFTQYGKSGGNGYGHYYISSNVDALELVGDVKVGGTLSSADPATYYDEFTGSTEITSGVHEAYQWYRSGAPISVADGGTGTTYLLKPADKGKTITLKITTTATGYEYDLPHISTTPFATAAVGTDLLPGSTTPAPTIVIDQTTPSIVLGFDAGLGFGVTGLTSPGGPANTVKYQWTRNGAAITGATRSTYTMTQADWGREISLRIITSHPAVGSHTYTTDTRYADVVDRSIYPDAPGNFVTLGGAPYAVGSTVTPAPPSWHSATSPLSGVTVTQQWYRNGVAIPASAGGTGATYQLRSADLGTTLTVRIRAAKVGYLPYLTTYGYMTAGLKVARGTLAGTGAPVVSLDAPTNVLTASAPTPTGFGGSPNAAVAYQWLRNGAAISGATHAAYHLTASDWGKNVKVRVTSSLSGYTTDVEYSPDHDYSLRPHVTDPVSIAGIWRVGETLTATSINFSDAYGQNQTADSVTFRWLRNGAPIYGATASSYLLTTADYGTTISLSYVATKAGFITLAKTVSPTGSNVHVAKGVTADTWTVDVGAAGLGVLTANVAGVAPASPTPTYSYRWYRNGTVITGATSKNYTLVAADYDKNIKVQVTISRTNFVSSSKQSTEAKHSIYMDPMGPSLVGPTKVGHTLSASPPPFYANSDKTITMGPPELVLVYTWYRNNVAIPGATAASYQLVTTDAGKMITVKVTAKAAGLLALTSQISNQLGPVVP